MGLFGPDGEKDTNNSEDEGKYYCDTCSREISKEEFKRNGGQCDHCVIENGAIGGGLV